MSENKTLSSSQVRQIVKDALSSLNAAGIDRWEILEIWQQWESEKGNQEIAAALFKAQAILMDIE
jgi:hypothetical protein